MHSPFLNSVRRVIRTLHYSIRTEQAYIYWIKQFILFHKKRHPEEMTVVEVGEFLSHLANERHVTAATQNLALNALNFLYNRVLNCPLGDLQPDTAGVTGSQGRLYHDDLHACAEPWRLWSAQPTGQRLVSTGCCPEIRISCLLASASYSCVESRHP